jgi:hypothetical protein
MRSEMAASRAFMREWIVNTSYARTILSRACIVSCIVDSVDSEDISRHTPPYNMLYWVSTVNPKTSLHASATTVQANQESTNTGKIKMRLEVTDWRRLIVGSCVGRI